jgi:hypothetical protein
LGFASLTSLWPLLVVAFMGPLNPSGGDVSVFLPLEHSILAASATTDARTGVFARYSFVGSVFGAVGALTVALPDWLVTNAGWHMVDALRVMFVVYAAIGAVVGLLYMRMPQPRVEEARPPAALGPSRGIVVRLAGLFSVDAFAGGLLINALLALWLFERFGMSLTAAGGVLFLDGAVQRRVAACRSAARAADRTDQHDGVYAHPGQPLPDRRRFRVLARAGAGSIARAQPALADGRADAQRLRHVGRYAGRATGRGELYRRATKPGVGGGPTIAGHGSPPAQWPRRSSLAAC